MAARRQLRILTLAIVGVMAGCFAAVTADAEAAASAPKTDPVACEWAARMSASPRPRATIQRVARNIKAAGGRPTAMGRAFVASSSPGARLSPALDALLTVPENGYSVENVVLAEDATPMETTSEAPSPGEAAATRPDRGDIAAPGAVRPMGSTPNIYYYCGPGIAVNQIWYCPPGNTCTSFTQWGHAPGQSRTSGCSWVYTNPCQLITRADPPWHDWVSYIWYSRTISGPPVLGDRWCG